MTSIYSCYCSSSVHLSFTSVKLQELPLKTYPGDDATRDKIIYINLFLHRWTSWHSWNSVRLARWSWLACPIWEPDPFSSCARTDFVGGVVIELLPLISDDSVNSWDWRTSISTYCTGAWRWSRYSDSMADRGACNGVCRWALWRERLIAGKLSQMPGKKCLHHDIQHVNWCQQCKQKVKRSRKLDIFRRSDNLRAEMEVALGKAYL